MAKFPGTIIPALLLLGAVCAQSPSSTPSPFIDFRNEKPGAVHKITPRDLPAPFATKSAVNGPDVVPRPKNAWPQAPAGFKVELYTTFVQEPRNIITAPNGDFFVAETHGGNLRIFRGISGDGKPQQSSMFAIGLKEPYGIAFRSPLR